MEEGSENQTFEARRDAWFVANVVPIANGIRAFAEFSGRGQPPAARVYLREIDSAFAGIAAVSLAGVIRGVVQGDGLTAMAGAISREVAKATGKPLASDEQGIALGYYLISLVCEVTGAAKIVAKHGDRPNKVDGGVVVNPSYELRIVDGQFLEDAAAYGATGMPTFRKHPPAPWTSQKSGGVDGQEEHGMVHGAGRQMRDVTDATAPDLYNAVNGAQEARFRVNPASASVVLAYDAKKAFDWLLKHFLAAGHDLADATFRAREAARL